MGTHPIFESDFDCLTDKKMDDTLDEQPTGLEVDLDFVGYFAKKRKISKDEAKQQLDQMKERKRVKQQRKHRVAVKAFLENNVDTLMDEDNEEKYAEYATCLIEGDIDDEELMVLGRARFAKLSLIDKYIFEKFESQKETNAALDAKYNVLFEGSLKLTKINAELEAENKKLQNELKKAKKETKKRKSDVKIDEAAPTAKELKLTAAAKEKE